MLIKKIQFACICEIYFNVRDCIMIIMYHRQLSLYVLLCVRQAFQFRTKCVRRHNADGGDVEQQPR